MDFKVISGDCTVSPLAAGGDFVEARATNTRLMGVLGIHVIRKTPDHLFHQLFYLDMEEYGFDDYRSYRIQGEESKEQTELSYDLDELFGSLGGEWVEILENEVVYLLKEAIKLNKIYGEDFPPGEEEYSPLINAVSKLTKKQETALWNKICCKITCPPEAINYFIMRSVAKDYKPLSKLRSQEGIFDEIKMKAPGTLYKNDIEESEETTPGVQSTKTYYATSLIEDQAGYRLLHSETKVTGPKITEFKIISDMGISEWEANNIIRKPEYLTLYKLHKEFNLALFSEYINMTFSDATKNPYRDGTLYMFFKKNNDHVRNMHYTIDQDTIASVFLSEGGELILSSYKVEDLEYMERLIVGLMGITETRGEVLGKFIFPDAALGPYLGYSKEIFSDFLDFIQFFQETD